MAQDPVESAHRIEEVAASMSFVEHDGAPTAVHVQVSTTTATEEEARQIARGAVEGRLAACAQVVGPIASTYWWQGAIETAAEWLCLLKTTASRYDALAAHIRSEHSYDTPEITATTITYGSPDYLAWISAETDGRR